MLLEGITIDADRAETHESGHFGLRVVDDEVQVQTDLRGLGLGHCLEHNELSLAPQSSSIARASRMPSTFRSISTVSGGTEP